jgi:hypothetical protein
VGSGISTRTSPGLRGSGHKCPRVDRKEITDRHIRWSVIVGSVQRERESGNEPGHVPISGYLETLHNNIETGVSCNLLWKQNLPTVSDYVPKFLRNVAYYKNHAA